MNARPAAWVGPRGIVALALLAAGAGFATLVMAWPVVMIAVAIVTFAALAADAAAVARAPDIVRTLPPHLMLARRAALAYTLTNHGAVTLRFAIYEAPAAKIAVQLAPACGRLPPATRTTVSLGILPQERGRTEFGVAFGWFESPLGFVRRRIRIGVPTPVRIRPDLSALGPDADLAVRKRLLAAGLRRVRQRGIGSEFESLREYAPGDAFRTIDWKATARRGKVMVAQYDVERSQQIVVAVDAGRLMTARLGDRRKLDYAVSAALAIAAIAESAADRVGLHAFASLTLASIAPGAGTQHRAALSDALTDLEPRFEESDYGRAALEIGRRYRKRSLIVVFTDLFDPAASSTVLAALALLVPHHLVLVVLMNDAAISAALDRVPVDVADAYRAGVAITLAAERARAVALLRNRGIGVVDVPAPDLSVAALDAYLDLKTRALL